MVHLQWIVEHGTRITPSKGGLVKLIALHSTQAYTAFLEKLFIASTPLQIIK